MKLTDSLLKFTLEDPCLGFRSRDFFFPLLGECEAAAVCRLKGEKLFLLLPPAAAAAWMPIVVLDPFLSPEDGFGRPKARGGGAGVVVLEANCLLKMLGLRVVTAAVACCCCCCCLPPNAEDFCFLLPPPRLPPCLEGEAGGGGGGLGRRWSLALEDEEELLSASGSPPPLRSVSISSALSSDRCLSSSSPRSRAASLENIIIIQKIFRRRTAWNLKADMDVDMCVWMIWSRQKTEESESNNSVSLQCTAVSPLCFLTLTHQIGRCIEILCRYIYIDNV